jgi:hypothetical protein
MPIRIDTIHAVHQYPFDKVRLRRILALATSPFFSRFLLWWRNRASLWLRVLQVVHGFFNKFPNK